jgi:[DsrC]-trisulfide reductase subunit M
VGKILTAAAYAVYAAFWVRFLMHALVWLRAVARPAAIAGLAQPSSIKAWALLIRDVVLFWRLLKVNPGLWFGEWVFHVSFLVVALRHLRYFFITVPEWVGWFQTPGLIAGYVLPLSLIHILIFRRFSAQERYSSSTNMALLVLLFAIGTLGLLMTTLYRADVVMVKLFIQGILSFTPAVLPGSILFLLHFSLVLVLIPFLPTHILTAPLVMLEAEKRELALHRVLHEPKRNK